MVHYYFTGYCVSLLGCIIFCLVLRNSALKQFFSPQRTLAVVLEPLRDAVLVEPVVAFVVVFILLNGFASFLPRLLFWCSLQPGHRVADLAAVEANPAASLLVLGIGSGRGQKGPDGRCWQCCPERFTLAEILESDSTRLWRY